MFDAIFSLIRRVFAAKRGVGLAAAIGVGVALAPAASGQIGADNPEVVRFGALDLQELRDDAERDERNGGPYRFAVNRDTNLTPLNSGVIDETNDGRTTWSLRIETANALNINLATLYEVPPSTRLMVLNDLGEDQWGAYTAADNKPHGELWTPAVTGDAVTVYAEVATEEFDEFAQGFRITKVNLGFRDFASGMQQAIDDRNGRATDACHIDVECPQADPWDLQVDSVGAYQIGGTSVCSGALVNNTAEDETPLFLTAYHCVVGSGFNGPSLVVIWNFQNSFCRTPGGAASGQNGNGSTADNQSGSTFRMAHDRSDTALFELDSLPNPAWGVEYVGWDRSGNSPGPGVGIHHPAGEEKRISIENNNPFQQTIGFNNDFAVTWRVQYDEGGLEGGSSGSPLFNMMGRVVGVASAVDSFNPVCFPQQGFYGQLAEGWDNGPANRSLEPWLDPVGTGQATLDALSLATAPPSNFSLVSPANGATNVDIPVTFEWTESVRADTYRLLVFNQSTGNTVLDQSGITGTSITIDESTLAAGTTYLWAMTANNAFGQSSTSTFSFETEPAVAPGSFSLLSPADGTVVSSEPTLDWQGAIGADTYTLTIVQDSDASVVLDETGITQSQFTVPAGVLTVDETYTWSVDAVNTFGSTPSSNALSFGVNEPVGPFALVSPTDGATGVENPPTFEWEASANADTYTLLAVNANTSAVAINQTGIASTSFTPAADVLTPGESYNWAVQARNELGSAQSTSGLFNFTLSDALPCPADVTGNGTVDLEDLLAVLGSFGVDDGGDTNGDGETDLEDLLAVLADFGIACP